MNVLTELQNTMYCGISLISFVEKKFIDSKMNSEAISNLLYFMQIEEKINVSEGLLCFVNFDETGCSKVELLIPSLSKSSSCVKLEKLFFETSIKAN